MEIKQEKRLIFIINHYTSNSNQHLFHVINLIDKLSRKGVKIALIIERCDSKPPSFNENVIVYGQHQKIKVLRLIELLLAISHFMLKGYKKVFIRITVPTAKVACFCASIFNGETYYWNSGGLGQSPSDLIMNKESLNTIRRIKSIGKSIDHFITGPESMIDYYPKYFGVPKNKMMLLYNDVDLDRFKPIASCQKNTLREELNLDINKKYVLFVHRFSPIRRSLYYIPYCISNIRDTDVVFLLIGSGPEEESVRTAVSESQQQNIIFLGSLPNNIIQKYYQACDVFFNPSYCEGFPRVVIEAMACGMPIVTTNAGGTADLFEKFQSEYVLDIEDRDGLTQKLLLMINSPEIRLQCTNENLKRIHRYSTEAVADMYINAFWPDLCSIPNS